MSGSWHVTRMACARDQIALAEFDVIQDRLFHFSEDGAIGVFTPRPVAVPSVRSTGQEWLNGPLVWAVSERRQAAYLFPRDCPRVLVWPTPETSEADLATWWGESDATMIAHVERQWFERIQEQVLFRYELPGSSFQAIEDRWMWVSEEAVTPIDVRRIDDLVGALESQGVELRLMDDLLSLRNVWETTLHASGIRLRNAKDWP
ncbi:MAG TPA: hypothetical protein VII67_02575 [Acidimicrobiales bacterium]